MTHTQVFTGGMTEWLKYNFESPQQKDNMKDKIRLTRYRLFSLFLCYVKMSTVRNEKYLSSNPQNCQGHEK